MATAREIMTQGCRCVGENDSIADAARIMRDENVGSLPICGTDEKLKGMLTDRDITILAVAEGLDTGRTKVNEVAHGRLFYVRADADAADVKHVMAEHHVRRVPVIDDKDHRLVGIVSVTDIAHKLQDAEAGQLLSQVAP